MSETSLRKQIGANLREARKRRGWSLQTAYVESGERYPAVVIGSYERGDRAVTVDRLVALAELYGVPPGSLLPDRSTDRTLTALVFDEISEEFHRRAQELREEG